MYSRRIKNYVRDKFFHIAHQRKNMKRVENKWNMIAANLPKTTGSLLDIGCSEGFFTRNSARLGWFAWGIDTLDYAIYYAIKSAEKESLKTAFFSLGEMNLEVAKNLPKYDVIILASVFQEICSTYGMETGYSIFDYILKACKSMLFFESNATNQKYGCDEPIFDKNNDLSSVEKWVNMLVERTFGWKVAYIGKTAYSSKEPFRFMFKIMKLI